MIETRLFYIKSQPKRRIIRPQLYIVSGGSKNNQTLRPHPNPQVNTLVISDSNLKLVRNIPDDSHWCVAVYPGMKF